jgi:hypothetical protein
MTAHPENDHPLHASINTKLTEIAAASPTPPPWYDAWSQLGPAATDRERLAVYRAVRDAGSVPNEAGFFLVAWILDVLTDERAEEGLREFEERLEQVRQKYGLEEETSVNPDETPPEYREAMQRTHDAWDALYATTLEEFGEHDMARLFREDEAAFDARYEAGRQFFHGPDDEDDEPNDAWLDDLLEAVSACVEADAPMGPMGLRYGVEEDFWDISVYPTPVELVGGAHDGAVVIPGFRLDLESFRSLFEEVKDFGWNALGFTDPEGPYVYIEGIYGSREVFVQVLAAPPEDEEPGLKLDATRRRRPRE